MTQQQMNIPENVDTIPKCPHVSINSAANIHSNVQVISIEGNIGSGKSTLLGFLRGKYENKEGLELTSIEGGKSNPYKVYFANEPVDEWSNIKDKTTGETILSKFYQNPTKYAFAFQMMAFITRYNKLKILYESICQDAKKNVDTQYIIFTERCLYTDKYVFAKMLYDQSQMEDVEFSIYNEWFESFSHTIPINKILYVRTNPEVCKQRVEVRNRDGEDAIQQSYLEQCHIYQERMINEEMANTTMSLTLNGNEDVYNGNIWTTWHNNVIKFMCH